MPHQVIIFSLSRIALNTMHRMVYPFLGVFRDTLGVGLPVLSLALTLRSVVGALGPFVAVIADRRDRKTGMLLGFLLFTIGAGMVVVWPSFPGFVLALLFTLLGKYVFDPSMQAYLGDIIVYKDRGKILALTEFGWSLSFILGVPVVGYLISRNGWQSPFYWAAGSGVLITVVLWLVLPKETSMVNVDKPPIWKNMWDMFKNPLVVTGLMMSVCLSIANEVVNLVFGIWMEDSFSVKIAALGAASAVIGLSELGGESLVVMLVDRIGKVRAIAGGLLANSVMAIFLPMIGTNPERAVLGLFLFYLTFEFTLVCTIPLMSEVYPGARATLMAFNAAFLSLGRAGGALIASTFYTGFGFSSNCLVAGLFNLLSLLFLYLLQRFMTGFGKRQESL